MRKINQLIRLFTSVGISTVCFTTSNAQKWDDKIIISQCTDTYTIVDGQDKPMVKNSKTITYESNSNSIVYPETYAMYGEYITLDKITGKGIKKYKNITPENVFYDDTKACFLIGYISKKGKKCNASYERTCTDSKYFTRIYLLEDYFIRNKTITVIIPQALSKYRIKEMNFDGYTIVTEHTIMDNNDVYTYTINNSDRMKEESHMPPASNVYPYLLITGSFEDANAFYTWSKTMADVDCTIPEINTLLQEINKNSKTDEDKISNTYHWVQENIRYVAFEAGESGHRPDTPQEVLRKKYGDCKGMALLLKTLLKVQGFDARLTDIGTDEIPYKMSEVPTLASANHVICTVFHKGKTLYLDATYNYTPYKYIPQSIQGSEAMIEDGDKPLFQIVPVQNSNTSIDSLAYQYKIQDNALVGKATYHLKGDMKEWFMSQTDLISQKEHNDILSNNLNADSHNMTVTNAKWIEKDSRKEWAQFDGDIVNKSGVQHVDNELYLELNPHNNFFTARIDTTQRTNDFYFPMRCNVVRQASVTIPAGYKVEHLPPSATFSTQEGTLTCSFSKRGNMIIFHQKMIINNRRIPLANIPKWNETVSKWKNASNEQVILKKIQ